MLEYTFKTKTFNLNFLDFTMDSAKCSVMQVLRRSQWHSELMEHDTGNVSFRDVIRQRWYDRPVNTCR